MLHMKYKSSTAIAYDIMPFGKNNIKILLFKLNNAKKKMIK